MFQKIVEFVNLRDRFSRSLIFASILVDMSLMELVSSVHSVPKAKELFAKEWLTGLPFSSSGLQGEVWEGGRDRGGREGEGGRVR